MIQRKTGALLAALSVFALSGCSGNSVVPEADPDTIRFGVVPAETVEATLSSYAIFVDLLEQETGLIVDFFEATNVAPVVEATIAGDLDLVMLGPFAQVMARDNGADISTVGALINHPEDQDNSSIGLSLADGGVTTLTELRGQDVCFIDPGSATGYLYPAAGLLEAGLDPESDINALFVGDHTSAVQSMVDGECAAVFTYGTNPEYLDAPDSFSVIFDQVVPNPGISVSTRLSPVLQQRLTEAVLKINGDFAIEEGVCTPDKLRQDSSGGDYCQAIDVFWGAVSQDDSYWESLREVCLATRAPACEG